MDAKQRCILCPSTIPLPVTPVAPGSSLLRLCASEAGKVESGTIMSSGGENADLVALWSLGMTAYQPLVVDGEPYPFCSIFRYDVRGPAK